MGLDSFNTDDDETETSSDSEDEQDDSEGGVLDSFRTSPTRGGNTNNGDSDNEDNSIFGLSPKEFSNMGKNERIRYIRNNRIQDYKPDEQLDDRWSFRRIIQILCVCDSKFNILGKGECPDCGREYMDAGRTVVKVSED